jgi:hypothetical protein
MFDQRKGAQREIPLRPLCVFVVNQALLWFCYLYPRGDITLVIPKKVIVNAQI